MTGRLSSAVPDDGKNFPPLCLVFFIVCCCFQNKHRQDGRLLCSAHLCAAGFPGKTVLKRQMIFFKCPTHFPPSSCEYEPLRVNSAYQCCFAAMCCAGWYYCTAQTDKVEINPHFVISFKTKPHQITGNSRFERIGYQNQFSFFNSFENLFCQFFLIFFISRIDFSNREAVSTEVTPLNIIRGVCVLSAYIYHDFYD